MADLTDEELDRARAREAWRIWNEEGGVTDDGHSVIAARLAREGWTPPKPVDPDLIEAREIVASRCDLSGDHISGSGYRSGNYDRFTNTQDSLTAIKQTKAKFAAVLDEVSHDYPLYHIGFARIREKAGL